MAVAGDPEFQRELRAAKLRALAEFAAGAGHEINNPVATIVGYVQQLLADETDPDRRHALTTIGGQAYRIRDMIGDVMLFARPPQPKPQPLDLAAVCREVVQKFEAQAAAIACRIELPVSATVPIHADPVQLRVVVSALLRNSLEAIAGLAPTTPAAPHGSAAGARVATDPSPNGRIEVSAESTDVEGRSWAVLRVTDNGLGLSQIDREHLFDPFYSGRQAGRGLGFGLPKAWRIVTMHGGRIEVETPADGGAVFSIHWPGEERIQDSGIGIQGQTDASPKATFS